MKILAYLINGVPVTNLTVYDAPVENAVIIVENGDPIPPNYDDVTSIVNWDRYGDVKLDYVGVQEEIRTLFNPLTGGDFSSLTDPEKDVVCKREIALFTDRFAYFGEQNTLDQSSAHAVSMHSSRNARILKANVLLNLYLSPVNVGELIEEADLLYDHFREYGIKGSVEDGGGVGIFDYLYSRVGTPYENSGLLNKAWAPQGGITLQELADKVYYILQGPNI